MYNKPAIDDLVSFIHSLNGIADKNMLAEAVKNRYSLTTDRKVYYCDSFAIRFSKSESKRMSNTVLSLSMLQKYDDIPFIVCIVSSTENYLLLANTTFLKKISHSSKELRMDNIKGSFNGGDIFLEYNELYNSPENFEKLYAYHVGLTFNDNLERLVDATNGIVGRIPKFSVSESNQHMIFSSVDRAQQFISSANYVDLLNDLNNRVKAVQGEIAIAALIDNVNLRGRVIEYLITNDGSSLKDRIIDCLNNHLPLPDFKTEDNLGDYSKSYPEFETQTDIKTKVLFLEGNPKAYNIDKLLEFLSTEKSIYMIYLLGVDNAGGIISRLCSVYDARLLDATNIQHHWAGRNTRGVTQFEGNALKKILAENNQDKIDSIKAKAFLSKLLSL